MTPLADSGDSGARRGISLALVLLLAKALTMALRVRSPAGASLLDATPIWSPAWVYQDLWVATIFLSIDLIAQEIADRTTPKAWRVGPWLWAAYAVVAGYTALNVPVAAVLGTPLTAPMLAGAGGALADSVRMYLTPANFAAVVAVLLAAGFVPAGMVVVARRTMARTYESYYAGPTGNGLPVAIGVALAMAALAMAKGPFAAVDAGAAGLARNALAALVTTAWRQTSAARPAPATTSDMARVDLVPDDLVPEGEGVDLTFLAGTAAGRNVLWIVLESTAARYLAPYGAAEDPMPNVTALARGGIVFDQAYAGYPESIKGLFTLLCAQEAAAYTGAADYAAARLPCTSLAAVLGRAGYQTALFHSGRFVYLGMGEMVDGRGFDVLADAGAVGGRHASSFGVDEASTVAHILDHVDRRDRDRPFFAMYLPIAGHHPYESPGDGPRPFGEADDFHRYLSDLNAGDHAIGQLLDGLRSRGLDDETLYIVSGDHGEAFFQHPGNFAHSLFIYEENVRVPLIVAAPGITDGAEVRRLARRGGAPAVDVAVDDVEPSMRAPQIAGTIDIAPTVLDLLGLPRPPDYRGRSLLAPTPGIARFFTDHTTWQMGLRDGRWKFVRDVDAGQNRLFDLSADPGETSNIAAREPDRVARYRQHLAQWSDERRAAVDEPSPPGPLSH